MHNKDIQFVFFGTPDLAVAVLEELKAHELLPHLIVTAPDKPQGRGLDLTPTAVKAWADTHSIPTLQPTKLTDEVVKELSAEVWDVFVVAAYGKIIPQPVIDIPKHGILNVHPSLLPKYRGAAPIRAHILNDDTDVGVTIMLLDAELDHGPIVSQRRVDVTPWPPKGSELENILAHHGGDLLAKTLPQWVSGDLEAHPQDHASATHMGKIKKEDGLLDLSEDPYQNYLKIQAFDTWPRTYFFAENTESGKKQRIIITDADFTDGELVIKRVIPEGKKETDWDAIKNTLDLSTPSD